MRLAQCSWLFLAGLCCATAHAQDILTPVVNGELAYECAADLGVCASALKQHGGGTDEQALKTLDGPANQTERIHYKMLQARSNDAFWRLVARAGSTPVDCEAQLPTVFWRHFGARPEGLGTADDDAKKSNFLALGDLLASIPQNGFPASGDLARMAREEVANVYRFCFADADRMFSILRHKLAQ